jgi:Staphylococcal nuclease homologue
MMSRLIFTAVTSTAISLSDDMTGQASIIDGDTLDIHGNRIRLWGVDAPESDQLCRGEDSLQYRCGARAANELDTFIAKRPVSCIPISLDQYGRTVATCWSVVLISVNGWRATASRWTGRSIREGDTMVSSLKPSTPGEACGRGAMLNPGCSASVSGKAGGTVRSDANAHP